MTTKYRLCVSTLFAGLSFFVQISAFIALPGLAQLPLPDDFNAETPSPVSCIAVQTDGRVLAGGYVATPGGRRIPFFFRLYVDGQVDSGFNIGISEPISSLVLLADGRILIVSSAITPGGLSFGSVARLNMDGTPDSEFNAQTNVGSTVAVQPDGKILLGWGSRSPSDRSFVHISRLNADGTLDDGFRSATGDGDPGNTHVSALAIQADGSIIVGGSFTTFSGQPRANLARFHPDGVLETEFNPGADARVQVIAVQADGKILLGGSFTNVTGLVRKRIARLNADGALDVGFDPGANGDVSCVALQTDGRILVAGSFTFLGGQPRTNIARLNADGTLDNSFNPAASGRYREVSSLALQADGKILVGGRYVYWVAPGGRELAKSLWRLNKIEPATQALHYDGSTITWLRGGSSPEVWRTTFECNTNGLGWIGLGTGTRVQGGWQLTGVSLSPNAVVRARGYVCGSSRNASSWFVESTLPERLPIRLNLTRDGSNLLLNWGGGPGPFQVQQATGLDASNSWEDVGELVQTNSALLPIGSNKRFLRVRGL